MGEVTAAGSCVTSVSSLPPGVVPARVTRVIDGDTYVVPLAVCTQNGVKTKPGAEECSVRVAGINAPEKVRAVREEKEEGSLEALDALEKLVSDGRSGFRQVYIQPAGGDAYGRLIAANTYMADPDNPGRYINLHAKLIRDGMAHAYFVGEDGEIDRANFLACQEEARAARDARGRPIGIWATDRFQGDLHITSFHANGIPSDAVPRRLPPDQKCNAANEHPNCEYFRVANVSPEPVWLDGYTIENCETHAQFNLPHVQLQPGETVKIYSGSIPIPFMDGSVETQHGAAVFLGSQTQIWANGGARVVIRNLADEVQDSVTSKDGFQCGVIENK
jgi:endonuclease YncB( thermonuclease family)